MNGSDSVNPEMVVLDFWDALMSGAPVLPQVDTGIRETIVWLADHDDVDGPAPQFVTRTRQRFASGPLEQGTIAELESGTLHPARPAAPGPADESARWRRAILPIAAALCLALGLAYLFGGGSLTGRLTDRWSDDPTAPALIAPTALPGTPGATPAALASPTGSPEVSAEVGSEVPMLLANSARLGDSNAAGLPGLPEVAWSFQTGNRMRSSPVLSDGVVYIGNIAGQMYAFNASNGDIVWQVDTGGRIQSTALIANDLVIVAAADTARPGFVLALDRATGSEVWRYPIGDQVSSDLLLYEGVVFLGSDDGFVYALDPGNGSELWKVDTGAPVAFPAAVDAGVLVVGNRDGTLFALDAATGAELWTLQPDLATIVTDLTSITAHTWSMPLIADGRVIVAYRPISALSQPANIPAYAVNLRNGEIEWIRTDLLGGGQQMLHWDSGVVRALTQGRNFAASLVSIDPATGESIQEPVAMIQSTGTTLTEGVISGDAFYLYIGATAAAGTAHLNVYELPSGDLLGRVELPGAGPAGEMGDGRPPIVSGGSVYLGTADGVVFALRAAGDAPVASPEALRIGD